MKPVPGWLTGLALILAIIALGIVAAIPRSVHVEVITENEVTNTNTTNYNAPVSYHADSVGGTSGEASIDIEDSDKD